ncbi:hypothetical protein NP493_601g01041 [Ridgeia piscesae]|uniref:Nucleolar complex protein 3 homolog n=1 Tax=Ridgeia piscesae TaxID=27915 RepID=A0AAD9NS18_RIDPI|nr:hypothetical protein NP493_601g01041 [Ridgeia piscesae]
MYEKVPRQGRGSDRVMKALLPIKGKGGIVQRTVEMEPEEDDADVAVETAAGVNGTEPAPQEDGEKEEDLPPISAAEIFARRQKKVQEKKRTIAMLSSALIENPEQNVKKLKELQLLMIEKDPEIFITVRKLATVSLLEIYKDIIPEYRIRLTTDTEKEQSMKTDTKQLLAYEESLLNYYKTYLERLERMVKGDSGKTKQQKKRKHMDNIEIPSLAFKEMRRLAVRCLLELLETQPHFNFRTNIIALVVPFMDHRDSQLSALVCDYVRRVFREDKEGEVTLEIVRLIGRLVKAHKFCVKPAMLETFMSLKIREIERPGEREEKKKAKKDLRQNMSRRERKRKKQIHELEKELESAAACQDKRKRLRINAEIISLVFLTYFRILKQARHSKLISSVLAGLAKFAHLINVEFFDDLFSVLNELVDSEELPYRDALHCIQTAFVILSGQGEMLNIDPLRFYRHLYRSLFHLHAGVTSEDVVTALECLHIMISKRRKQVSHQRVLAFTKRLSTLSLQLSANGAVGVLASVRNFLHTDSKTDILYDTECQGSGLYLPELNEPEYCNAHNTALYELHLLTKHYHPAVRQFSDHLLIGAPSQGAGQLPVEMSRKSPSDLFEAFDASGMRFNPPIPPKAPNRKQSKYSGKRLQEFQQDVIREVVKGALAVTEKIDTSIIDFSNRKHIVRTVET